MTAVEQQPNDQWLNHIRDQVRAAFRGPDVRMPSTLGDMITRETKSITKPRIKVPEPPEGLTADERRAWRHKWRQEYKNTRWNAEVHATESDRHSASKPLFYRFPELWVLRRIRQLPAPYIRILRHLYSPSAGQQNTEWLANHLWEQHGLSGLNTKTKRVVYQMYALHIREMKTPFGWVGLMSEPWSHFDLDRECWKKTYRDHWVLVRENLVELDAEALWRVSE